MAETTRRQWGWKFGRRRKKKKSYNRDLKGKIAEFKEAINTKIGKEEEDKTKRKRKEKRKGKR